MRIGIDARKIHDTGIGRYIRSILQHIFRLDPNNQYYVFLGPKEYERYRFPFPQVQTIKESAGKYSLREHLSLALKARHYQLDLFHAPHYVLPLALGIRSVVTIHDTIHLLYPPASPLKPAYYLYARLVMEGAIRKSRLILTGSANTKRDLLRLFLSCPPHKIWVTPYGVGEEFYPRESRAIDDFLRARQLPTSFFLYVGDKKPHKNLSTLIEAFSRVVQRLDCYLVMSGPLPGSRDALRGLMERLGVSDRIIFTGYLPDEELPLLYNGARVFVFPSLYEGFGLPPLEAMACGLPVICSHSSSLPETVGDGALLLPPKDIDLWSDAMYNVFTNSDLRQELRKKGLAWARKFSWQRTARLTLEAYNKVLGL